MLLSAAKTQQQQSPPGPGLHSHPVNALRGDSLRGVGPGEEDAHARQRNVRPFRHKHFGLLAATGCCGDGGWGGGGSLRDDGLPFTKQISAQTIQGEVLPAV